MRGARGHAVVAGRARAARAGIAERVQGAFVVCRASGVTPGRARRRIHADEALVLVCEDLRRVALIRAAQSAGLSLDAIANALAAHPQSSSPTAREWAAMSSQWRDDVDRRIDELMALRDQISSCIGCGCLSLDACGLFNPGDQAAGTGTGARYLQGESRPST